MKRVSEEIREEAIPFLKAGLETYADAELVGRHEQLLGYLREGIAHFEKEEGLTVPEFALKRCAENPALFANLPTPWGGTVKDHVLRDYEGFEATAWAGIEPLNWNRLPANVPYATKLEVTRAQFVEATAMLASGFAKSGHELEGDATVGVAPPNEEDLQVLRRTKPHPHGDETWDYDVQNHVRWVVAAAQYWLLLKWQELMKRLEHAPQEMARPQRIEAIIDLLKLVMPDAFDRVVEAAKEEGVL